MTPALGRLHAPDPRDLKHLLRMVRPQAFAVPIEELPISRHYQRGAILNQEQTSCCVEFSLEAKLRGMPVRVGPSRLPARYEVYDEAIQIDEFPDNNDDIARCYGTTIRAGCRVLERRGLISSYEWTYSVDEILQWMLGGHGGLNLGIDWYEGMNQPSPEGIIRLTGKPIGGHAIYSFGIDRQRGLISLQNSWGPEWGGWELYGKRVNPGCAKLPLDDLKRLLDGNGEAVRITEVPYVATRAA